MPKKTKTKVQFFEPDLAWGAVAPPQKEFHFKFGGLPWGLPTEKWPKCGDCEKPLSLMAQFLHHTQILDLGKTARALYVFHCSSHRDRKNVGGSAIFPCVNQSAAAIIIEPDERTNEQTPLPNNGNSPLPEGLVIKWQGYTETVNVPLEQCFVAGVNYDQSDLSDQTKLGGAPWWWQGPPGEPAAPPWKYVLQITDFLTIQGAPPAAALREQHGLNHITVHDDGWTCGMDVLGSDKLGYVFINIVGERPDAVFFTQA